MLWERKKKVRDKLSGYQILAIYNFNFGIYKFIKKKFNEDSLYF